MEKKISNIMYRYFFYFLYSYYDNTQKWKEAKIPYLSTILVISVLQMFNYLFLRDLILFQIQGIKYKVFSNENFIIPTLFIGFNYWFFKRKDLYLKIQKQFVNNPLERTHPYWVVSWVYLVLSIAALILMGYSVKNNIRWF